MLTNIPHVFILCAMEHVKRAIQIVGNQKLLGIAVGVVPQVVNNWLRRGNIPAEYCPGIERATKGAVRCEDLRPDVDWAYLRATNCDPQHVGVCSSAPTDDPAAPLRALACATESVRLTADRRDADRRDLVRRVEPLEAPHPDQLPLALAAGESHQEAA